MSSQESLELWERTPEEKMIASIRKEIALDIKSGTPVGRARQKANLKYGEYWREVTYWYGKIPGK